MNDFQRIRDMQVAIEALGDADPNSPEGIVKERLEMVLFKLQTEMYGDVTPALALAQLTKIEKKVIIYKSVKKG